MGTYNVLQASVVCPRCGSTVDTSVDCYFGATAQMQALQIGDRYPWLEGRAPASGGRPEGGSLDGEGYMECPSCGKDAFLRVVVRGDIIRAVAADPTKPGHIP